MHYEVELRELLYEDDGAGGLRVTGSYWKPVRVFNKDAVPIPLTVRRLVRGTSLCRAEPAGCGPHRACHGRWRTGSG